MDSRLVPAPNPIRVEILGTNQCLFTHALPVNRISLNSNSRRIGANSKVYPKMKFGLPNFSGKED